MLTWKVIDGDIDFDGVGRPYEVERKELLSQLVKELLLNDVDERGFGASLGKTGFDIITEVYEGIRRFRELQQRSTYKRHNAELLKDIVSVNVLERTETKVKFLLIVNNMEGRTTEIEISKFFE